MLDQDQPPALMAFMSPTMLFVGPCDRSERLYFAALYGALRAKGYRRFVEPACGGFTMSSIAKGAGIPLAEMEASDVGMFSAVCGALLTGTDLSTLDVRLDGVALDLAGSPVHQATFVSMPPLTSRSSRRAALRSRRR
jgi:hypothetical protein